ncbi:hypothetical protein RSAG8_04131, partial [Rhizoctonia solani AG-8 WAC10335]
MGKPKTSRQTQMGRVTSQNVQEGEVRCRTQILQDHMFNANPSACQQQFPNAGFIPCNAASPGIETSPSPCSRASGH